MNIVICSHVTQVKYVNMSLRTIVEESTSNLVIMDVFSKLIQTRIIFIDDVVDDEIANNVIAQMMYLDSVDPNKEISIYINTPGGSVIQGLAIYDVAKLIKSPITTICIGQAASMGAILMLMGKKRCGLKHSRFLLHQISGGTIGNLSSMKISLKEAERLETFLYDILREKTTVPDIQTLLKEDLWLDSDQAKEYGIITDIL